MAAIKRSAGERIVDGLIVAFMCLVIALTLYPFIYVFSMSISNPIYVIDRSVWLYPKGFSLKAYEKVFENPDIWTAYFNTVFFTLWWALH